MNIQDYKDIWGFAKQSGTTVKPKLILSIGISSAVQYTVGMQKVKCTVHDKQKNRSKPVLFVLSQAIGDYAKLVLALIEALKKDIKAFGIVPKLSGPPGKVWRGAPALGQDIEKILSELLGYDAAKIAELREKKLV